MGIHREYLSLKQMNHEKCQSQLGINVNVFRWLFNMNLIDDFKLFVSGEKLGKNGRKSMKSFFGSFLKNKKKIVEKINLSGDKLISYKIK